MSSFRRRQMLAAAGAGVGVGTVPVQYITSGSAWSGIDTMLTPTADLDIVVHMVDYVKNAGAGSLFTVSSWGSSQRCLWANGDGSQIRAGYGNAPAYAGLYIDISGITFGEDGVFEQRGREVFINGTSKGSVQASFTPEPGVTLHIGDNSYYGDECNPNKFGEVLIYDEYGGTLLLELTPVRTIQAGLINQAGQSVGANVGGFIDRLTGNLYTATSGADFIAGPDVA